MNFKDPIFQEALAAAEEFSVMNYMALSRLTDRKGWERILARRRKQIWGGSHHKGVWRINFRADNGYQVHFRSLTLEEAAARAEERALLRATAKGKPPLQPQPKPGPSGRL